MAYKVLVVDDQAMPRQLFENMIKSAENYELVACIETAKVADMYCARQQVDLILMDVVMNDDSNGLDVAAKIKESYPKIIGAFSKGKPYAPMFMRKKENG